MSWKLFLHGPKVYPKCACILDNQGSSLIRANYREVNDILPHPTHDPDGSQMIICLTFLYVSLLLTCSPKK